MIIKIIACQPGITLTNLLLTLRNQGVMVSERTLVKDIMSLKVDFKLLPSKPRLREGYFLQDMVTLAQPELGVVIDALCAFAISLKDSDSERIFQRISSVAKFLDTKDGSSRLTQRYIGQRIISRDQATLKELELLIMHAIRNRLPMKIHYASPRTPGTLTFDAYPLFKIFYERAWYVIIRNVQKPLYHPCRMDRIARARILDKQPANTQVADDVHQSRYLISCGWGMTFPASTEDANRLNDCPDTIVRFDSGVAQYILEGLERHPRARIVLSRDGTGDVFFKIKLADLWEFKHWVRSFGSQAWFVAPESAVEEEKAEIARLRHRYRI